MWVGEGGCLELLPTGRKGVGQTLRPALPRPSRPTAANSPLHPNLSPQPFGPAPVPPQSCGPAPCFREAARALARAAPWRAGLAGSHVFCWRRTYLARRLASGLRGSGAAGKMEDSVAP